MARTQRWRPAPPKGRGGRCAGRRYAAPGGRAGLGKWIRREAPQLTPKRASLLPQKKSFRQKCCFSNIGKQSSCPLLSRPSGPAHLDRRGDPLGDCDHACFAAATSERATSSRYAIGRRRQRTARLEEASRTAAPSRGAIKSDPSMIDLRSRCGPCWAK